MKGTLNAHKVFRGTEQKNDGYIFALKVSDTQKAALQDARDTIRITLKAGFANSQIVAPRIRWIDGEAPGFATRPLVPRFRMQGSAKYFTLNSPAHQPPQQVDFDDGMFLPISFVAKNGGLHPALAAESYFRIVEAILDPLCKNKGWVLSRSKPTCVRIQLNAESHIDLPLYAIPDRDFATLVEARITKGLMASPTNDDLLIAEDVYKALPQDKIMLANRTGQWTESDPRKIEDWFVRAVDEHGKVLRRVCRYLKGWRDYQWRTGGPSSITLMACVVNIFDQMGGSLHKNRDDLVIQEVARRLPKMFLSPIKNPVLPSQTLDKDWSGEERKHFHDAAENLRKHVDAAVNGTYEKSVALTHLRAPFGNRIPNDHALIDIDSEEREIMSHEPIQVAAPFVPRTTSG